MARTYAQEQYQGKIKDLYGMKLHEEQKLWHDLSVIRVPGGWIYRTDNKTVEDDYRSSSVFVPFNNEFMP
jgi:hypothetical protein